MAVITEGMIDWYLELSDRQLERILDALERHDIELAEAVRLWREHCAKVQAKPPYRPSLPRS